MPHSTYPRTPAGNRALVFGHALLHTYWRRSKRTHGKAPKNWPPKRIMIEHSRHVKMMLERGMEHKSPLVRRKRAKAAHEHVQNFWRRHFIYRGKFYPALEIPVVGVLDGKVTHRTYIYAPESLREAMEKNSPDLNAFTEANIDGQIYEYQPLLYIEKGDVAAILKNRYDVIEWKLDENYWKRRER